MRCSVLFADKLRLKTALEGLWEVGDSAFKSAKGEVEPELLSWAAGGAGTSSFPRAPYLKDE